MLPGRARRHPRPQRRAARRLRRRPDGGRRPDADREARRREIARFLADRLDLDYFDVLRQAAPSRTAASQYIARRVPADAWPARVVDDARRRAATRALDTRRDPVRDYPADDVAANLVGFIGHRRSRWPASSCTFDKLLAGTDGSETYEVGGGNRIPLGDNSTVPAASTASDLHTDHRPGPAVVHPAGAAPGRRRTPAATPASRSCMDTRTGELLALADYPTYDANATRRRRRKSDLGSSRRCSDVYEPGSVEKVLTAQRADRRRQGHRRAPGSWCRRSCQRSDRVIHDWFPHGTLHLTLAGVIAKSSNIGTVLAADAVRAPASCCDYLTQVRPRPAHRHRRARRDRRACCRDRQHWTQIDQDRDRLRPGRSRSTRVQMAAAVNTIANGGVCVTPSLVKGAATTDDGQVVGTDTTTTAPGGQQEGRRAR